MRGVGMWFVEDKQKENESTFAVSTESGGITGHGGREARMARARVACPNGPAHRFRSVKLVRVLHPGSTKLCIRIQILSGVAEYLCFPVFRLGSCRICLVPHYVCHPFAAPCLHQLPL
jgi:hypothetical protein